MDIAYDHITEETFSSDRAPTPTPSKADAPTAAKSDLNTEFQETFRAFSNSPWGTKLGGLWGNVRKQGEQYYEGARREVEGASGEALKGISGLRESIAKKAGRTPLDGETKESDKESAAGHDTTPKATDNEGSKRNVASAEGDADRDQDGLIFRFRSEAAKRLKDIEKAEDAADEALLRFGTNIRNFFAEAVAIAPPSDGAKSSNQGGVLFESKDHTGKRVIHTTRFDAQLHVIHSALDGFTRDPISGEWPAFAENFDVDQKTSDISGDLERYPDLRRASEQFVPEKVPYKDFWCRYYFLRLVIETEEQRRKELLKGTLSSPDISRSYLLTFMSGASQPTNADEEVSWDADSDSESEGQRRKTASSPSPPRPSTAQTITLKSTEETASTTTLSPQPQPSLTSTSSTRPKPAEGRRSNDQQSQPDSDASYDLVSGATSKAPGSPREDENKVKEKAGKKSGDESDEDWE